MSEPKEDFITADGIFSFNTTEWEAPTSVLRWSKDGKLQQQFALQSDFEQPRYEWRDVPTEGEDGAAP